MDNLIISIFLSFISAFVAAFIGTYFGKYASLMTIKENHKQKEHIKRLMLNNESLVRLINSTIDTHNRVVDTLGEHNNIVLPRLVKIPSIISDDEILQEWKKHESEE